MAARKTSLADLDLALAELPTTDSSHPYFPLSEEFLIPLGRHGFAVDPEIQEFRKPIDRTVEVYTEEVYTDLSRLKFDFRTPRPDGGLLGEKMTSLARDLAVLMQKQIVQYCVRQEMTPHALAPTPFGLARMLCGNLTVFDSDTAEHSQRVGLYAERLAQECGIVEPYPNSFRAAGLLHDIGKLCVPQAILQKPGKLVDWEFEATKSHAGLGHHILSACANTAYEFELMIDGPVQLMNFCSEIAHCHHEKPNGRGYPRNLVAADIPAIAKLFAVCDVWDALRSERPYKPAHSEEKAAAIIQSMAAQGDVDMELTRALLKMDKVTAELL